MSETTKLDNEQDVESVCKTDVEESDTSVSSVQEMVSDTEQVSGLVSDIMASKVLHDLPNICGMRYSYSTSWIKHGDGFSYSIIVEGPSEDDWRIHLDMKIPHSLVRTVRSYDCTVRKSWYFEAEQDAFQAMNMILKKLAD